MVIEKQKYYKLNQNLSKKENDNGYQNSTG